MRGHKGMFSGTHFYSMDKKGRVSIPSEYREIMQQRQDQQIILTINLTSSNDDYLMGMPNSEWVEIEAKLRGQSVFDQDIRDFNRFFLPWVMVCPLDRQGRILVPPHLRDYAKLVRDIALVGVGSSFEIWDRAAYVAHWKQLRESFGREGLKKLAI